MQIVKNVKLEVTISTIGLTTLIKDHRPTFLHGFEIFCKNVLSF